MLSAGIQETDVPGEREWVLPTRLAEKWTLRRFAEVFDGVGIVPPGEGGDGGEDRRDRERLVERNVGTRRGGKRILLATASDDSTIVYYVVHDGIVKPRQN